MNNPIIETYKGIDIYYNKENGNLYGKDSKTGEEFQGKYLFELVDQIDKPYWEEYKAIGFVKSGFFNKELQKVESIKRDRKSKKSKWKIIEATDNGYDVGKEIQKWEEVEVYVWSEERQDIYNQVKKLQEEIEKIEKKQRELVETL